MSKKQRKTEELKALGKAVKKILKAEIPQEKEELRAFLQSNGIKTTNVNGIALAMVLKALGGDKQSAEWVREASGEKEKDEVNIGGDTVIIISGDEEIAE